MKFLCPLFIIPFLLLGSVSIAQTHDPTPEQICNATIDFFNALHERNFLDYKSGVLHQEIKEMGIKTYTSHISFPGATITLIEDTSSFNDFRLAKVTYAEEQLPTKDVSSRMLELYTNLNLIFSACLEPNHFSKKDNHSDVTKINPYETNYSIELPNEGLFTPLALSLKVSVQVWKEHDEYKHQLLLRFKKA